MDIQLTDEGVNKIARFLLPYIRRETTIICVGTDKVGWDSVGPITGTMLKANGCPLRVEGTLEENVDAKNVEFIHSVIKDTLGDAPIIAIDSTIVAKEYKDEVGLIAIADIGLRPRSGLEETDLVVGDCSLIAKTTYQQSNIHYLFYNYDENLMANLADTLASAIMTACGMSGLFNIKPEW